MFARLEKFFDFIKEGAGGLLPGELADVTGSSGSFGGEVGAVVVGGFEGVEDFVEVGFDPVEEQGAVFVDEEGAVLSEEVAAFGGEHIGVACGMGGDDGASCGHVFHEDEVGSAFTAVGEKADVGMAVELSEVFVGNRAEGNGAGEVNAVVGEEVGDDFLVGVATEGA